MRVSGGPGGGGWSARVFGERGAFTGRAGDIRRCVAGEPGKQLVGIDREVRNGGRDAVSGQLPVCRAVFGPSFQSTAGASAGGLGPLGRALGAGRQKGLGEADLLLGDEAWLCTTAAGA